MQDDVQIVGFKMRATRSQPTKKVAIFMQLVIML